MIVIKGETMSQRRALQLCLILVALVILVTGVLGLLGVLNPLYGTVQLPLDPLLDTNLRFYSGLWLVIGLAILATVRNFEDHLGMYRLIWAMLFVGGVGRMVSLIMMGTPPFPIVALMILELSGAPSLAYWQHHMTPTPAKR
jgi:hypothetical protein